MLCLTDSLFICACFYISETYISENQNLRIHSSNKTLVEIISYYSDCTFHCPKPATTTGWMTFVIWPKDNMETQVELLKGTDSLKTAHINWSCPKRCLNNVGISFRSWVYLSRVTSISMSSWLEYMYDSCFSSDSYRMNWCSFVWWVLLSFLSQSFMPTTEKHNKNTGKKPTCCLPRLMQGLGDCWTTLMV